MANAADMKSPALLLRIFVIVAVVCTAGRATAVSGSNADPFLWLEQVDGARATAWVKEQNARTLGILERDPDYAGLEASALAPLVN